MKTCAYCGEENDDERSSCRGCGTELPEILEKGEVQTTSESQLAKATTFAGVKLAVLGISALVTLLAVYLLSFGPVSRSYVVCAPVTAPPFTNTDGTVITSVIATSVAAPVWVEVVYEPLFSFLLPSGDDSDPNLRAIYSRYLAWWQKKSNASP